jgi:hypothetical protein
LTSRIRVRDAFAALAVARQAAEKAEHVGLPSEVFALEGFVLGMMAKHVASARRFFFATCLKQWPPYAGRQSLSVIGGTFGILKLTTVEPVTRICTRSLSAYNKRP